MAKSKSIDERIEALQQKQEQLKAQEKALKAKRAQEERKARTKRLIEVGAIVEKGIGIEFDSQQRKDLLLELFTMEIRGRDGSPMPRGEQWRNWILQEESKTVAPHAGSDE